MSGNSSDDRLIGGRRGIEGNRCTESRGTTADLIAASVFKIRGNLVVIVAGGYTGWGGIDAQEIHAYKHRRWFPTTDDFIKTAQYSVGHRFYAARDTPDFFRAIQRETWIGRLIFLGHLGLDRAGGVSLGLSGDRQGRTSDWLDAAHLAQLTQSQKADIRKRLRLGVVDLVLHDELPFVFETDKMNLMQHLASAFGVCVRSATDEVKWEMILNKNETVITRRGIVAVRRSSTGSTPVWRRYRNGVVGFRPKTRRCP